MGGVVGLVPDVVLAERYRLRRLLGTGGMSAVWQAYDVVLERQVAIKVLAGALTDAPELRQRVRAEARAAAKLLHPHLVSVFDYAETTGPDGTVLPFVVMELVVGESLERRLAAGPLPWPLAVRVTAQIADALAAAHGRGVVHRDVTAGNVILTDTGVKVVDFGISATIGDRDGEAGANHLLGTPAYLAPERLIGLPVAPPADVYSLGVLLHTMLAGTPPFTGDTTTAVTQAHWYRPPAPLPPIPGLPAEVDRLRRRCLAKRAKDRPTAAHLVAALSSIQVPDTATETSPPVPGSGTAPVPDDSPKPANPARPGSELAPCLGRLPAPLAGLILTASAIADPPTPAAPSGSPAANGLPAVPTASSESAATTTVDSAGGMSAAESTASRFLAVAVGAAGGGGPTRDLVVVRSEATGGGQRPGRRRAAGVLVTLLVVMAGVATVVATVHSPGTPHATKPGRSASAGAPAGSLSPSPTKAVGRLSARPKPRTHSAVPPVTRTAAPAGPGSCQVQYATSNDWGDGFTAAIAIHSDRKLDGWALTFRFPAGQQITKGWNGKFHQRGNVVTVRSPGWDGGGDTVVGFNGSYRGSNPPPTGFTLNGTSCSAG